LLDKNAPISIIQEIMAKTKKSENVPKKVVNSSANALSRWALKNTTKLRNVNRLKAYIQSVSGALHKFT
jgi:hypothetical protein